MTISQTAWSSTPQGPEDDYITPGGPTSHDEDSGTTGGGSTVCVSLRNFAQLFVYVYTIFIIFIFTYTDRSTGN